jgi:glycosyltransferase involved in cell wall biosynthesis
MPAKVHALGPGLLKYGYSPKFIPWLKSNAREYDAAVVRGLWQYSGFGVWRAMRKSKTPYFVYPHGMLDPWFKKKYPLKHLKKWFYWPWGEYRVLRDAKAVLFTCEQERILARRSFWMYRCNEKIVNYGTAEPKGDVSSQRDAFLREYPGLENKRMILFVGRIHPKKGCDLLIDALLKAAGKDKSLHLVIAGPDQVGWQGALEERAEKAGMKNRITWTGMLSGELKWGAFYSADVFILPSHQENFGISAIEALACGLPALVTNKVNIWREIESDSAGFAAEDNLEGTIELIERWLSLSDEEKNKMRKKAKKSFYKRFEIHKAAESLVSVIRENA